MSIEVPFDTVTSTEDGVTIRLAKGPSAREKSFSKAAKRLRGIGHQLNSLNEAITAAIEEGSARTVGADGTGEVDQIESRLRCLRQLIRETRLDSFLYYRVMSGANADAFSSH